MGFSTDGCFRPAQVVQGLVDGDPLELPAGVYRVEALTNPTQVLEAITVGSGQDTVLRVTATQ
jgi:hypothetical protein